jgi:hypothetical protein
VSTLDEWINVVGLELGIEAGPDGPIDRSLVLDLARDVAHGVARPAAPLTTYLLGVAVGAGADAREAAGKIVELAEGWDPDKVPDPNAEIVDTVSDDGMSS